MVRRELMVAALALCVGGPARAQAPGHPKYDYPTAARADYVIGCLMDHDFKHEMLDPCACKIDVIADRLPYVDYDRANTITAVQRHGGMGYANVLFRDTPVARDEMKKFKAAAADADKLCTFPVMNEAPQTAEPSQKPGEH